MSIIQRREAVARDDERDIVTGMCVNTQFLKGLQKIYRPDFLSLGYARVVAGWCNEYFSKYEEAPGRNIQSIFQIKKSELRNPDFAQAIDVFLESLSESFVAGDKAFNPDFELDKAKKYFKVMSLQGARDKIQSHIALDDIAGAEAVIANYKRVEALSGQGVNIFGDIEAAREAIRKTEEDELFNFPGALGEIVKGITRGDFFCFFGPASRGKSWLLIETAVLAVLSGIKVLFISLEMLKHELQLRIYQRLCGEVNPQNEDGFETIKIPAFDQNYDLNDKIHFREVKKFGLTEDMIETKLKSMQSMMRGAEIKLECFPEGSINVSNGIIPLLDNLFHYEGYVPGLILFDYPDIFGAERNIEKRHQIDETWRAIRSIGQDRKIPIGAVSHTNKATWDRDIRQGDASEDKRKMDHVTIGIALNQNEEDQDRQIMRFGILKHRFKKFSRTKQAVVLQCLDIGRPYIDSRLMKKE